MKSRRVFLQILVAFPIAFVVSKTHAFVLGLLGRGFVKLADYVFGAAIGMAMTEAFSNTLSSNRPAAANHVSDLWGRGNGGNIGHIATCPYCQAAADVVAAQGGYDPYLVPRRRWIYRNRDGIYAFAIRGRDNLDVFLVDYRGMRPPDRIGDYIGRIVSPGYRGNWYIQHRRGGQLKVIPFYG